MPPVECKHQVAQTPHTPFVTDLDGTLLAPDGQLSAWTRTTLTDVLQRDCPLTYATARSRHK